MTDVPHSDLAVSPGEYLCEVLAERGMTQAELSRRTGRPVQAINEIIKGNKAITSETALQLADAVGVPAHVWTGLEAEYRLVLARQTEEKRVTAEVKLLPQIPYADLVRIGMVRAVRGRSDRVRELHRFFGVSDLRYVKKVSTYCPAWRRSTKREASPYALATWLRAGEIRARAITCCQFDRDGLRAALPAVRSYTLSPPSEFLCELTTLLAGTGVALVLLPHFRKTYANGATFPACNRSVLLMSIRGKWADVFWFSLLHEIGHLVLHDKRRVFIEDGDDGQAQEEEANKFAAELFVPEVEYSSLLASSRLDTGSIAAFAKGIGIHPGIVVGRLQHDGHLPQNFHSLRQKYEWATRNMELAQ